MTELGVVRRKIQRADRAAADALASLRRRDRPRGDGPRRPHEPLYAADLSRRAGFRHGGHGAPASGRQLDDACRRRADSSPATSSSPPSPPNARTAISATCSRPVQGARRARAHHRRGRARREDADRNGLPGVEQMRQRQGHGQGDARFGQHSRRLRRRARQSGRCDRRRRRRRGRGSGRRGRKKPSPRRRRAKTTRATSGRSSPRACLASTCTRCASRSRRPA